MYLTPSTFLLNGNITWIQLHFQMTYGGRVITLITITQHGHADSSKVADQGMTTATTKSQLLPHPSPATFCRHLSERRRRRRVFTIMMASHNAEFTTIIKFNCCPLDGRMDGAVIIRHVPRKMRNVLRLMVVPSNVVTLRQLCTFITSSSSTETQHHLQMHFLAKSPTTNRMTGLWTTRPHKIWFVATILHLNSAIWLLFISIPPLSLPRLQPNLKVSSLIRCLLLKFITCSSSS